MNLADRLQQWWDRLRGYEPPAAKPNRPGDRRAGPAAARPLNPLPDMDRGTSLSLSVEGAPTHGGSGNGRQRGRKRRHRESGFDPYSSTGGYGKPRNWDDVPRK